MPVYTYKCRACGLVGTAYRKVADRHAAAPIHCELPTELVITPTMVAVFSPYQTVAHDKETGKPMRIRTQREHEAFLRRNNFEEVGNDKSCAPLMGEDLAEHQARRRREDAAALAAPAFNFDTDTHEATL